MIDTEAQPDFAREDPKTTLLADIVRAQHGAAPRRLLVIGCGSGVEAAALAQRFDAQVTGIDIAPAFDQEACKHAELLYGDATRMVFDDASFDCVYSYHVLEHIPDFRAALAEMRRVLKPGGSFMIGTPNRSRVVGYLGSSQTPLRLKVQWNLDDWWARMRGRFRNELGAHAGYTFEELRDELGSTFSSVTSITPDYYYRLYRRQAKLVSILLHTGTWRFLFPAIYFYGVR